MIINFFSLIVILSFASYYLFNCSIYSLKDLETTDDKCLQRVEYISKKCIK